MDSKTKLDKIKELLGFKGAAAPAPAPAPEPPDEKSYTLKDGTKIQCDGGMGVGAEIQLVKPTGLETPPDGNLELETGEILTVNGGKITNINKSAAPNQGMNEEYSALLSAAIEPLKKEIELLKTQLAAVKDSNEKETASLKEAFTLTVELVDEINKKAPEKPVPPINSAFAKTIDKEKNLESISNAIREITKNK